MRPVTSCQTHDKLTIGYKHYAWLPEMDNFLFTWPMKNHLMAVLRDELVGVNEEHCYTLDQDKL